MSIDSRFVTQRIAMAIADEQPIDWLPAEQALGEDSPQLENLRLLHDVAVALRSAHERVPSRSESTTLFRWGPLEVCASLGAGQTGEVFRAYDPVLQRDVALKLRAQRDPMFDPGNAQLLDEARKLAQIRHRNVLAVYGAAVHDGRAGIWSELIDGRTLKDIVAGEGAFGVDEALRIGIDVARALGMVHAAGLVHGDVKAENVMRERGGRIVLMDFGASGRQEELAARLTVSGTRRYLAPEILDGAAPDVRSDLYSLAVLLHFLLSGETSRNDDGGLVALAQRRPDLPDSLCMRLDGLLAVDPAERPQNAAAFAQVLLALLPERVAGATPVLRRRWLFAGAALLAALALGIGWELTRAPSWRVEARFIDPVSANPIVDRTPVRIGDALALQLDATRPTHVYVLNEDADGELNVLFPLAGLDLKNPLPGERALQLPGSAEGRALSWQISSPTASEEFVMIASPIALTALERRIASTRQAAIEADATTRGAALLRSAPLSSHGLEGTRLIELVELARHEAGDADTLQVLVLRLPHAK